MSLGDEFEVEVGSSQVVARLAGNAPRTVAAMLPYASVGWRNGDSTYRYRMTTFMPGPQDADESEARAWLPAISAHNGDLAIEHGLHQEIGWERQTDAPACPSWSMPTTSTTRSSRPWATLRGQRRRHSAPGLRKRPPSRCRTRFSAAGLLANVERRLPGGNQIRLGYANGDALVMPAAVRPAALAQVLAGAHPRHAQMYALSLSGTLDGTGTRWRASFRWQPEATVTRVAPYAVDHGALPQPPHPPAHPGEIE